jgi:hypothetical protein
MIRTSFPYLHLDDIDVKDVAALLLDNRQRPFGWPDCRDELKPSRRSG